LGEAASWDTDLAEHSAAIAAAEARAAGVHWTFAPMVDIARDPRWGRIIEGAAKILIWARGSRLHGCAAFREPITVPPISVMACAKHFAAYGAAEAGRDYNTTDMSERKLRETYLPPFKATVEAGVGSFMTSFNSLERRSVDS
jgi:beta-glucosidase